MSNTNLSAESGGKAGDGELVKDMEHGKLGRASVETASEDDDRELEALGYVPSFKREFSNLATVSCGPEPPQE